jgi:Zn-dependent protease with chaperone function
VGQHIRYLLSRWIIFAIVVFFLAEPSLLAQSGASAAPSSPAATDTQIQPQPQASPDYTLSPERAAQAVAYARVRHILYFLEFGYGLLVLLAFLKLRVAPVFRNCAERAAQNRVVQSVVFVPLLLLTLDVLSVPFAVVRHSLARYYAQSIQGWGSWLWDWTKSELLSTAVAIFLIWLLYAVMRRSRRRWWLYVWVAFLPILVFGVFIYPLFVEPLFFRFTPLADAQPQLAAELERVVTRAGEHIPQSRMFEMNASSKLNELNAYVTGIGASRRVVVWDTTIARMTAPEIAFVFGHEMGHYVLGHVRDGMIFTAAVLLVFLFLGSRLLSWAVARWGGVWGLRGVDDWASLPVLLVLVSLFNFLFTPIGNAYSRHLEHQADQYGLEVVHGIVPDAPQVAAAAFQVLGDVDLEEPAPSLPVKIWFYDHPPIAERMAFAHNYDPWARGEAPAFVK